MSASADSRTKLSQLTTKGSGLQIIALYPADQSDYEKFSSMRYHDLIYISFEDKKLEEHQRLVKDE